jgi:diguanylate cyclase (GGDEF)-like protein
MTTDASRGPEPRSRRPGPRRDALLASLGDTDVFLLDRRVAGSERRLDSLGLPSKLAAAVSEHYRAAFTGEAKTFDFGEGDQTCEVHLVPLPPPAGEIPQELLAVVHDVTPRRRAEDLLARRVEQQRAIADLGQLALRSRDVEELLGHAVRAVAATLDADLCDIFALQPDAEELRLVAASGWPEGAVGSVTIANEPGTQAGHTLELRRPIFVEHLAADPRFVNRQPLLELGVVSCLSIVIDGREQPFGALAAHARSRRRFTADDATFLAAVAAVLSSAVERHREERVTEHAALHDALTGLPNRALGLDRLCHALARRQREGIDVAILVFDLDRFKLINDSLGHGAGDELLVALAPRLLAEVRPTDTVARLGGDEFLVVCEGLHGAGEAIGVARRLGDAIARPIGVPSGHHHVTASIGIAVASHGDDTPESLLRDADAAMYRAKERGRGRYELFDDALRRHVLHRVRTDSELRRALDRSELDVHYQPVVDLRTGAPVATEALVRWRHPERGLVGPTEFIPIAEETGLILRLGRWVLERAVHEAARWQDQLETPITVTVNVSGRQVADATFPAEAEEIVACAGVPPGTIALEITESVLMDELHSPAMVLGELHDRGFKLILDDFGTGYSSLSYLKRFSLDILKINRSFVSGIARNADDRAIVEATIRMAHALGMTVIAEGIETEEQRRRLAALGCERAQGFLLSKPLPAAAAREYLGRHITTA